MKNNIKVSVCVVSYNQEKYIAECLQSLVDQVTTFPFEIIVSDDCSTDKTQEIIEDYASRYADIIKICHKKINLGPKENIISTYKQASGRYIAICEGDDYWISNQKLQKQYDCLERDTSVGLVHSGYKKCNKNGVIDKIFKYEKQESGWIKNKLLEKNRIATLTVMVRRELLLESLDQVDYKKYKMLDLPMWMAISIVSKIEFIDEPLACYRVVENSLSHQIDINKHKEFVMSAFDVKFDFLKIGKYSLYSSIKILLLYLAYRIKFNLFTRKYR